jgi:nitrogen regulatory protein PII
VSINSDGQRLVLVCVIVSCGKAGRVLQIAREKGVSGGTIVLARGTAENRWLKLFDLTDIRQELVILIAEEGAAKQTLEEVNNSFHMDKPSHGIAFAMPLTNLIGDGQEWALKQAGNGGATENMYNAIFVVVDRGKGSQVMEAAKAAGARGGTVINARGAGDQEKTKVFHIEIEPEKEIVLILAPTDGTEAIVQAVRSGLQIDEPGKGIIFVQSVLQTYGLQGEE